MVKPKSYIPDRGDIIYISMNPQKGHEQAGKRPVLVLTPAIYNKKSGLAVCCPITSKIKGYPFEVRLQEEAGINGAVLSDQVKSMDWRARNAEFSSKVPSEILEEVSARLRALLVLA